MHVLIAVDGSTESIEAARQLVKLPLSEKPKVTVVSALIDSIPEMVSGDRADLVRDAEKKNAEQAFATVSEILEGHCSELEQVVDYLHPNKLILQTARERSVDLILLGARGHSAIYRVMLGSTADYIANHAECSVVLVRSAEDGTFHDASKPYKIALAYDGSRESKVACSQLCSFDWPESTQLHIAMVLEKPKLLPEDEVYDAPEIEKSESELSTLEDLQGLKCQVKHSVREAVHIGNAVRVLAEKEECNMLFFGGTGKSAIAQFFLGSVSRYLLHHVHCTLWIAKEKHWR